MNRIKRAVGALVVTGLVAGGAAVVAPSTAQASPTAAAASQRGLLPDLTLTGSGKVGQPIGFLVNGLSQVLPVQWLRDGASIPGATGASYVPTVDDIGHSISALITLPVVGALATPAITIVGDVVDPGSPGNPTGPGTPTNPTDPVEQVLELISGLGLPGSAEVGQLISLTAPVWSLPGVSTSYQWLRDGVPIPGADGPSYVPTLEDAGHSLSAQVTGALAGVPLLTVVTSSLGIPLVTKPTLNATGDVSVAGAKKIGTPLTLSGPTWDAEGATTAYQWMRDDAPITGATSATYTLVAADFGHAISVVATGHKDGYTDNTVVSDPIQPIIGDAITFVAKPRVTGTPKVGQLLTADPGQWTGGTEGSGQPVYTYQWLRDGQPISGQVAQTYQVAPEDIGKALSVTIVATRPAYKLGKFTTAALTVDKLASSVTASLSPKKVKQGKAALMKAVVKAESGVKPTGTVTIFDGTKKLKSVSAAQAAKGVSLTGLKAGKHKLRATYAGSDTVAAGTSKTVVLTVTKPTKKKHKK